MKCVISGESSFVSDALCGQLSKNRNEVKMLLGNPLSLQESFYSFKPDTIFYVLKDDSQNLEFKNFIDCNLNHLLLVLEKARDLRSNFVLLGSKPLCGQPDRNPGRLSHHFAEEASQMFCQNHGLNLAVVRFFEPFGSLCQQKDAILYKLQKCKSENKRFVYNGSEDERKSFIHIDDIVSGVLMISRKKWNGQIFNLGMKKNYSIKELVEIFKIEDFVLNPIFKQELSDPIPDTSFMEVEFNWKCKNSIESYISSQMKHENRKANNCFRAFLNKFFKRSS